MIQVPTEIWDGCYDDSWDGFIVPDAFAHPAKFSRGLIGRIFEHMLRERMIQAGDMVVDPFGGIACGGIVAASWGLRWLGCELEEKFCLLAQQNIAMHRRLWEQFGDPVPVLVQGDSRKLRENLGPVLVEACVSSPPYVESINQERNGIDWSKTFDGKDHRGEGVGSNGARPEKYGDAPGQLGAMKPGDVACVIHADGGMCETHGGNGRSGIGGGVCDSVVTSPPYADGCAQTGGVDKHPEHIQGGKVGHVLRSYSDAVITSPPYAESLRGDNSERETAEDSRAKRVTEGGSLGQSCRHSGYGGPGNLGNLPSGQVDACVTSPPYEGSTGNPMASGSDIAQGYGNGDISQRGDGRETAYYGKTNGQIGHTEGETFWHAARDIVAECFAILKHGGWSAWVVKNFVRNKKIMPFCDDWCRLLEASGFVVVKRVRAMLVKHDAHPGLFGEDVVKTTKRASFFRRLYEAKYPENAIEWEEVVFAQKRSAPIAEHQSSTWPESSGVDPAQPAHDTSPSTGNRRTSS